jgi:hypothetical protein
LEYPEGVPWATETQHHKLLAGNAFCAFMIRICQVCEKCNLVYSVENPQNSWMWKQPGWEGLRCAGDFLVDYCRFGTPWRKATRFRTNGQLRHQRLRCNCGRRHTVLRGRHPTLNVNWTKLAEPYPRQLARLLGFALAQDAGWLGEYRPLDIVKCARCKGARFGEAVKPGPRRARPREPRDLSLVELVEPNTAALRDRYWGLFTTWLDDELGAGSAESVLTVPGLLARMLTAFAQHLYDSGTPLSYYRQLIAHAQRVVPTARPLMRPAWDMVTRWERLEPVQHRPPVPEPLLHAMCAVAASWRWTGWCALTLACFYGICRVGELQSAKRSDLLTPQDLFEEGCRIYLLIREPKSRGRGARVQHATITGPKWVLSFLCEFYDNLPRSQSLYPGSAGVYRRRWDYVLKALGVPKELSVTPGSLRGGGAVAAFRSGTPLSEVQWRMRLLRQTTLSYYLQETTAASVLPSLPPGVRENVRAAALTLPAFLSCAGSPK